MRVVSLLVALSLVGCAMTPARKRAVLATGIGLLAGGIGTVAAAGADCRSAMSTGGGATGPCTGRDLFIGDVGVVLAVTGIVVGAVAAASGEESAP